MLNFARQDVVSSTMLESEPIYHDLTIEKFGQLLTLAPLLNADISTDHQKSLAGGGKVKVSIHLSLGTISTLW